MSGVSAAVSHAPLPPPPQAGKTVVANFLAGERSELALKPECELGPTVGARILKFDRTVSGIGTLKLELWDVSGNERFEATWPAVKQKADGVIIMYNPADGAQANEVGLWQQWFAGADMDARSVVVFAYRHNATQAAKAVTPPKALISFPLYETSPDTPAALRDGLDNLLDAVNRRMAK